MKWIWIAAAVVVTWTAGTETGRGWNDVGRRLYVEKAVDGLPKPLKSFYEANKAPLAEAVSDPSRFGRAIFEVDRLEPFPFADLPTDRELAVRKYGEETLKEAGDVPWRLIDSYKALVEDFRKSDFKTALAHSEEIAFLVGELYMPLNVSKNGDGEPTGQQGLRERFDSRLMEAFGDKLKISPENAVFLDRPAEYAVSIPLKSFIFVDNILYFDYLSHKGVQSYDRFYYEGMWLRGQTVTEQLLASAAQDTASFWYTAWVEARKPELPKS
ncbi:MAG TPA: hypothetical protein VIE88_07345 [Vicinamibacteria bacterium]